jgi:hypothetical protein
MSHKIFEGKLFRVRTATVRPCHQITEADGKRRPRDPLPAYLWYSKVDFILSLEVTNDLVVDSPSDRAEQVEDNCDLSASPRVQPKPNGAISISMTEISPKPFAEYVKEWGGVGREELEAGDWVRESEFSGRGSQSANSPQSAGGEGNFVAGSTPLHSTCVERAPSRVVSSQGPSTACTKKDLESAIYRKNLFELYDNLPPKFDHKMRVEEMTYKAAHDLFMNRRRELEAVSEEAVLNVAQIRLCASSESFEKISDYERRRKVVVACVVNAVVEAVLRASVKHE